MVLQDNISLLVSSSVIDVITGEVAVVNGPPTIVSVDSENGTSGLIKPNQTINIKKTNVFSKILSKGTVSFWSKCPFLLENTSVPVVGIAQSVGDQVYATNSANPVNGMMYFYFKPDLGFDEGEARIHISLIDNNGVINSFSAGPIEIFEYNHYIFTYNLSDGIMSLYINGSIVDLRSENMSVMPAILNHNSLHDLVINKFANVNMSGFKSGNFEISDVMVYSDFISDISDVALVINNSSFNFLRRKTGQMQGELPNVLPPAIAQEFNRGRINDIINANFGMLAGTDDGNLLMGSEKIWQRKISFGNPIELSNIKFKKVTKNYSVSINSEGFLVVTGSNFNIF